MGKCRLLNWKIRITIIFSFLFFSLQLFLYARQEISPKILKMLKEKHDCGTNIIEEIIINWDNLSQEIKNVTSLQVSKTTNGDLIIYSMEPILDQSTSTLHFIIEYTTIGIHGVTQMDSLKF